MHIIQWRRKLQILLKQTLYINDLPFLVLNALKELGLNFTTKAL